MGTISRLDYEVQLSLYDIMNIFKELFVLF